MLTSKFRVGRKTVFDMVDRLFGKPFNENINSLACRRLEIACESHISLSLVASCLIFEQQSNPRLVV